VKAIETGEPCAFGDTVSVSEAGLFRRR